MAAAQIELECPSCGQVLRLDAGFAGGVCRCSACATLMTVPSDPRASAPERLKRPDTPVGARPERPDTPGQAADTEPAPSVDGPGGAGVTTYTTESGRTVDVEEAKVPTAAARRAARRATTAVFVAAVAVLVAAAGAAVLLLQAGGGDDPTRDLVEAYGYDPDANPFTLDEANVLGLPLTGGDAVVLDASSPSQPWLGLAGESAVRAIGKLPDAASVAVVYATDAGPQWLTAAGGLTRAGGVDLDALQGDADAMIGRGRPSLGPAVAAVKAAGADRVLLLVGRAVARAEAGAIADGLGDDPPRLDVVLIDVDADDASPLSDVAGETGGRLIEVSSAKLVRWYRGRG